MRLLLNLCPNMLRILSFQHVSNKNVSEIFLLFIYYYILSYSVFRIQYCFTQRAHLGKEEPEPKCPVATKDQWLPSRQGRHQEHPQKHTAQLQKPSIIHWSPHSLYTSSPPKCYNT